MSFESFRKIEGKESLKKVVEFLPSSFSSIDPSIAGVTIFPEEMELKTLTPKILNSIHSTLGHATRTEAEYASPEDVQRYMDLLESQAQRYLEAVRLLKESNFNGKL